MGQDLKIALSFSGGGFRAAGFALGTLSYLYRIRLDGQPLLHNAHVISTVSGGTITGAHYALGIKRGEAFEKIYNSLYTFLETTEVVPLALEFLREEKRWAKERKLSLINAFADVYNECLFNKNVFGELMQDANPIHLRHICFNSTEFSNGLQFRFQWTDKVVNPKPDEPDRGLIGNFFHRIHPNVAREIRMGDILAASSCFPAGFEPINFPGDFVYDGAENLAALVDDHKSHIALMDGGIVDNQGIESILLADNRMNPDKNSKTHILDLVIVSDVASPFMNGFQASKDAHGLLLSLTPVAILLMNSLVLLVSLVGLGTAWQSGSSLLLFVSTVCFTLSLVIYLITIILFKLARKLPIPDSFFEPLSKLLRLKLSVYRNLISNRVNSVLLLMNDVFLKHLRRLNYRSLFKDKSWHNRRIMNAIYELKQGVTTTTQKFDTGKLDPALLASDEMSRVVKFASSMGTTLWFTRQEIASGMLDAIVATGQFTICWNLIEYIQKLKSDKTNTRTEHEALMTIEDELRNDWEKFRKDPLFLVRESRRGSWEPPRQT